MVKKGINVLSILLTAVFKIYLICINLHNIMNKKYLKTYNCSQPLGNSSNMHEDIFARIVTFARGVTFLQKHFCTDGNICTKGHF